jgi:hypothetical protein
MTETKTPTNEVTCRSIKPIIITQPQNAGHTYKPGLSPASQRRPETLIHTDADRAK